MKISNASPAGDNLLERMQQIHDRAVTGAGGAGDAEGATQLDTPNAEAHAVDSTEASEAPGRVEPPMLDHPVVSQVVETARAAISGRIESPRQVREQVIEVLVDERYGEMLPHSERPAIVETLKATLTDDPQFRREVDNMLLLAARRVGRGE